MAHDTEHHIFLSYCRADMSIALQIREALESAGHKVWQDTTAITGGAEWIRSIEDGIERAYACVSVISTNSQKSDWVTIEYLHAQRRQKQIIPIKIDQSEIPIMMLYLNVIHCKESLQSGIHQLLSALPTSLVHGHLEKPPTASTSSQRLLEVSYVDRLLLEYSVWQTMYTPMAGVATISTASNSRRVVKRQPTNIRPTFTPLQERIQQTFAEETHYTQEAFSDITEAVSKAKQLIILGEPGSGKTTTLWKVAADYAEKCKVDSSSAIPVFVRLGSVQPNATIEEQVQIELGDIPYSNLAQENRLVLLLDGLNELALEHRLERVEEIKTLTKVAKAQNRLLVVTCRELDYVGDLDLEIDQRVRISPLSPDRIMNFCNSYLPDDGEDLFWQIAGSTARKYWDYWQQEKQGDFTHFWFSNDLSLLADVYDDAEIVRLRKMTRGEEPSTSLLTLAANPFMLYMMTEVYAQNAKLPDNKGKLFEVFVDFLMREREHIPVEVCQEIYEKLANMAFQMQLNKKGTGIIHEEACEYLSEEHLRYCIRSNILSEANDVRFTHQLIQEYFAAIQLNSLISDATTAFQFFPAESWWEPQGWEETAIFLAGQHSQDCSRVVMWLKDAQPELAARCALESGAYLAPQTTMRLKQEWMIRLTQDATPPARAAVGRALGKLKLDARRGVGLTNNNLPDIDWVLISSGEFTMGSSHDVDPFTAKDETPQIKVYLPDYYISRYLITYAQYGAFMQDKGYERREFWTEAGWKWLQENQIKSPHFWSSSFWNISNHALNGVSWYEAFAFTQWLSFKLRLTIRLPTEQEWEKVTRGTDAHVYIYGNTFDPNKANLAPSGIGRTSAVGLFPESNSPIGQVADCSGNVFEWCLTKWGTKYGEAEDNDPDGTAKRVLRGGSWWDDQELARVACRSKFEPHLRYDDGGFRIVRHP